MKKDGIFTQCYSKEPRNKLVTSIWIWINFKPTSYSRSYAPWSKSHVIQLSNFLKVKICKNIQTANWKREKKYEALFTFWDVRRRKISWRNNVNQSQIPYQYPVLSQHLLCQHMFGPPNKQRNTHYFQLKSPFLPPKDMLSFHFLRVTWTKYMFKHTWKKSR